VTSKKLGCLAKMSLKKIVVYPDYPVECNKDWRNKKKVIAGNNKELLVWYL